MKFYILARETIEVKLLIFISWGKLVKKKLLTFLSNNRFKIVKTYTFFARLIYKNKWRPLVKVKEYALF